MPTNKTSAYTILNKFLVYKKYPKDILKIEFENIPYNALNNDETLTIAYFDYINGVIKINELALSKITTLELVAVIAHEIEHFDQMAKLYNSLYLKNKNYINSQLNSNLITINKTFWDKASSYANTTNFSQYKYQKDFINLITQTDIHTLSVYPYLNKISYHINNSFEQEAYNVSNKILSYYDLPKQKLSISSFVEEFELLNNKIKNITNSNSILSEEDETFFDYLLINTLIENYSEYKTIYEQNINYKNSDMTPIFKKFIEQNKELFTTNPKTRNNSYSNLINLIKKMNAKIDQDFSKKNILEAMEYKINTIKNNIYKETTIEILKEKILNYLKYAKQENILNPQKELMYIIDLLCIENKIYSNNKNSFHSYYSKIPQKLFTIYEINTTINDYQKDSNNNEKSSIEKKKEKQNKINFYKIIYNNTYFIREKSRKSKEIGNSEFLKELIEKKKINIKI